MMHLFKLFTTGKIFGSRVLVLLLATNVIQDHAPNDAIEKIVVRAVNIRHLKVRMF